MLFLLIYFVVINVVTIGVFSADKDAAVKGEWRIPERRLWLLCALGGTPGALLAMQMFRHKRRKTSFVTVVWLITACQLGFAGYVMLR